MKKTLLKECLRIAREKNTPDHHDQWGKFHHFAFVVQNNKIIEWATNKTGESPTVWGYQQTAKIHAEFWAYQKAKGLLDKNKSFELVNLRLNKNNELRMSKPCSCCYNFLKSFGCIKIWFTTDLGFAQLSVE